MCSDYFEQIFQEINCKHPVIVLKDIKRYDLECLLSYMYLGEVNVVQEKLAGLIKAAECLRIKGLAVPDEDMKSSKQQEYIPNKSNRRSSSSSSSCNSINNGKSSSNRPAEKRSNEDSNYSSSDTKRRKQNMETSHKPNNSFTGTPSGMLKDDLGNNNTRNNSSSKSHSSKSNSNRSPSNNSKKCELQTSPLPAPSSDVKTEVLEDGSTNIPPPDTVRSHLLLYALVMMSYATLMSLSYLMTW